MLNILKKEIKDKSNTTKCIEINLINEVKELYNENFKTRKK